MKKKKAPLNAQKQPAAIREAIAHFEQECSVALEGKGRVKESSNPAVPLQPQYQQRRHRHKSGTLKNCDVTFPCSLRDTLLVPVWVRKRPHPTPRTKPDGRDFADVIQLQILSWGDGLHGSLCVNKGNGGGGNQSRRRRWSNRSRGQCEGALSERSGSFQKLEKARK